MKINFDGVKKIIAAVAPTLATALGGPLAGMAVKTIAAGLGKPDASEQEIAEMVASGDPQTLLRLREIDTEFQKHMASLDVDLERIAAEDRSNARQREIQLRDYTPSILASTITIGFFGTLSFMLMHGKPDTGGDALLVMLGSLGTAWAGVVSYYFGSSAGSRHKTDVLSRMKEPA